MYIVVQSPFHHHISGRSNGKVWRIGLQSTANFTFIIGTYHRLCQTAVAVLELFVIRHGFIARLVGKAAAVAHQIHVYKGTYQRPVGAIRTREYLPGNVVHAHISLVGNAPDDFLRIQFFGSKQIPVLGLYIRRIAHQRERAVLHQIVGCRNRLTQEAFGRSLQVQFGVILTISTFEQAYTRFESQCHPAVDKCSAFYFRFVGRAIRTGKVQVVKHMVHHRFPAIAAFI